jgi:hypothetical protein
LRAFQKTVCPAYKTAELPAEEGARIRRQANAARKAADLKGKAKAPNPTTDPKGKTKAPNPTTDPKGKAKAPNPGSGSRRQRTFNLNTYKVHALGGYAKAIRKYGSMDNFNSQTVCMYDIMVFVFKMLLLGRTGTSTWKTDI